MVAVFINQLRFGRRLEVCACSESFLHLELPDVKRNSSVALTGHSLAGVFVVRQSLRHASSRVMDCKYVAPVLF